MKITIFGTGYVGLVTAACLADIGNEVLCFDIDKNKISKLQKGVIGIFEPNLNALLKKNKQSIRFTNSIKVASNFADHIMICIGTPERKDGSANLSFIKKAIDEILLNLKVRDQLLLTIKSTVPPGTSDSLKKYLYSNRLHKKAKEILLASNPEFLKEGTAVEDFMKPDRVIVGINSPELKTTFSTLYGHLRKKIIFMDVASAELTKYAANTMLASRITFINEISRFCQSVNASIDMVVDGISADKRIGKHFLKPGPGYGGSCFPKDVSALSAASNKLGVSADLISAINVSNRRHKEFLTDRVIKSFNGVISNKIIALWGLTFKANTDDIRQAYSFDLINRLLSLGAIVQAFDPEGIENSKSILLHKNLVYCSNQADCLKNASCLVIATEWECFKLKNLKQYMLENSMKKLVLFDYRNLYKSSNLKDVEYHGLG